MALLLLQRGKLRPQGKQPFPESFLLSHLPSKKGGGCHQPKEGIALSQSHGQTPGSSGSAFYHQSRPSSGADISSTAPQASCLLTEGQGSGGGDPSTQPLGQWDSERSGECWVLTSQSREAGATAMQASWGPSSTSRCLRNVLSWELPRSFPHHPQPLIPSYACSSSAFTPPPSSFISLWEGLWPTVPLAHCYSPASSQDH